MLDFIKKLFVKKEIQKESIPLNELDKWYGGKKKNIYDNLSNEIKVINDKIIDEIEKAGENIILLEKSRLKNPNISMREKQFMEGNRAAYIKKVGLFLKQIELPKDVNSAKEFFTDFNNNIESFSKQTAKPYHILQEFFSNEANKIANNIGNVDRYVKELKGKVGEVNLDSLDDIKEKIKKIKCDIERKKNLEEKKKKNNKRLEELNKTIKDLKKKVKEVEESKEYKDLLKLKEERQKLVDELSDHKETLTHSFAILERALRKYSRIAVEDEKRVIAYLDSPILVLRKDPELRILKILSSMESSINNNTIDLKEKKKKKTIEEIKRMGKDYFESFLSKYTELINKIADIDKKIISSEVERNKGKLKKEFENKESEEKIIEQNIENLKKEIEKIDIGKKKNKIEEEIKKVMNVAVAIS